MRLSAPAQSEKNSGVELMASSSKNYEKRNLVARAVTLALIFFALLFAVLYIISLSSSLGWFADMLRTSATGMSVAVASDDYTLLVERTNEFDSLLLGGAPKYEDVPALKTKLAAAPYNFDFAETSTASASALALELVNETVYTEDGVSYRYLMPGSCGTMTFYLRPNSAGDVVANLQLDLSCFFNEYVNDTLVLSEETDPAVINLLRGHILFFTGRTGNDQSDYKYNGLMDTGAFTYDTSEHVLCSDPGKTDCYKIELYWVWPMTYQDIADNTGAAAFDGIYPPELADFVNDSPECFFATNAGSSNIDELNDGYNDGDQTIGEHANSLVAYISIR